MMRNLTKDQIEAMSDEQIAATREGLREALMAVLAEIGVASDVDPIEAARTLATSITIYGTRHHWNDSQIEYAVAYIAQVGRTLQRRFECVLGTLVDQGVEVWCHQHALPALYSAEHGCSACHCDGVHTTLVEAAEICTHGSDCLGHPGVDGPHNYDR